MAMKIDGNLSGYAAGMQNYSSNAAREEEQEKIAEKEQVLVGKNLDLQA